MRTDDGRARSRSVTGRPTQWLDPMTIGRSSTPPASRARAYPRAVAHGVGPGGAADRCRCCSWYSAALRRRSACGRRGRLVGGDVLRPRGPVRGGGTRRVRGGFGLHRLQPARAHGDVDPAAAVARPVVRRGRHGARRGGQGRQGARHVSRVVPAVAQLSLPVLAPAAVLAVSPPVSSWADAPVIAARVGRLYRRRPCDLAHLRAARARPAARIPSPAETWVYGIDLLLAPVGVAMAIAAAGATLGGGRGLPAVGLPAACVRQRAPVTPRPCARALGRVPGHRDAPRRHGRERRRLHRLAQPRRRRARRRGRHTHAASRASACATWSSAPSCTMSARSPYQRRSSTSPAR